jgi:hypothetical protein
MFAELHKMIGIKLLDGPKTVSELAEILSEKPEQIELAVQQLITMGIVERTAEGKKLRLKESVRSAVMKRRAIAEEDKHPIRIRAFIEMQAPSVQELNKLMDTLCEAIKKTEVYTVYHMEKAEPAKQGEYYTSYCEVELSVKNLTELMRFALYYGPSVIEVLKPEKVEVHMADLQDALMEAVELNQKYTRYIEMLATKRDLAGSALA